VVLTPTSRAPSRLTAVARSALPYNVKPEEQPECDDERDRDAVDPRGALAGEAQRGQRSARLSRDARAALAFGAEEQQPEALQREMAADGSDQQHQHGGMRQWLECEPSRETARSRPR